MEYNFSKHSVGYRSSFLDTVNEQIVDVDITLPDYCPDIEKILKCTLIPKVYTRTISGGQLTIDGESMVRVLYCDSLRHNIRSFTQSVPFTVNFSLKTTPEQYIVLSDTKCEYINCRALSPRKLVIHGAFSLYAKVLCRDTNEFFSFDDECDLQTKCRDITVSDLCCVCQDQFMVTEDIELGSKPPVESLLSYDVTSHITEIKSIYNKIMLNAELNVKLMYLTDLDSGEIEHVSYLLPINHIIDCDGVIDDTVNIPHLEIMSCDLQLKNDSMNDGTYLRLDAKLCYSELGYTKKDINIVEDAYSTTYEVEQNRSSVNFETNQTIESVSHVIKSTLKIDSVNIAKVLDIYSQGLMLSPVMSEEVLSLSGKSNICILLEDSSATPSYVERTIEIDFNPELSRTFDRAQINNAKIHSISFRLVDDNTIEIRAELKVSIELCDLLSIGCVTSVVAKDDNIINHDDCSLILYYADKGESVWDIAKAYYTKESSMLEENSLACRVLDSPQMLLVPKE